MDVREVAAADTLPLERLEAEITEWAGHLAAAQCRWIQLIAEYDRREGWKQWGCHSVVQWLGWHCGLEWTPRRVSTSGSGMRCASSPASPRSSRPDD